MEAEQPLARGARSSTRRRRRSTTALRNSSFVSAECLMKAGRLAEARERFELARDLDVLRFRADSRINADHPRGGRRAGGCRRPSCRCGAGAGRQSDPDATGIPGGDLFYEHVHLTFDGNYLLARAVFDQVCEALPQLAALEAKPGKQGESHRGSAARNCWH